MVDVQECTTYIEIFKQHSHMLIVLEHVVICEHMTAFSATLLHYIIQEKIKLESPSKYPPLPQSLYLSRADDFC